MKLSINILLSFSVLACTFFCAGAVRDEQNSYEKLIALSGTIFGTNVVSNLATQKEKVDGLIDLHTQFCQDFIGRPVTPERIMLVKTASQLFLKQIPERYKGDKLNSALISAKDLIMNRAVFVQLLMSEEKSEFIERQLWAYLERNQTLSCNKPVAIYSQLSAPVVATPLIIVGEGVRLVEDKGTSGHHNMAVDAGETVTLNIPLKNVGPEAYRSTSGFLTTSDRFVRADALEVIYSEKTITSDKTITFAPGTTIVPKQNFTFTISPDCPDGHIIRLSLVIMDSDHPQQDFSIPLNLKVYNVGPLDYGSLRVDDDMPGLSDGNANGVIEPGETIEYVLALQNRGVITITNVEASLLCTNRQVVFRPGDSTLRYGEVPAGQGQPISAAFVFALTEDDIKTPSELYLQLLVKGLARGMSYSWVQSKVIPIGVSDQYWGDILKKAQAERDGGQAHIALKTLEDPRIQYRFVLETEDGAVARTLRAEIKSAARLDAALTIKKCTPITWSHALPSRRSYKDSGGAFVFVGDGKIDLDGKFIDRDANHHTYTLAMRYYEARGGLYNNTDTKHTEITFKVDGAEKKINEFKETDGFIDNGVLRLVYSSRLYAFLFRLDYGTNGVPTRIPDFGEAVRDSKLNPIKSD